MTWTPPNPLGDDGEASYLMELLQRPEWHKRAACRGMKPDLFFPGRGDNDGCIEAKQVCRTCPVRAECLKAGMTADALTSGILVGACASVGIEAGKSTGQMMDEYMEARHATRAHLDSSATTGDEA